MTNQVEEFKSIKPGFVKMYTCGPTVYNYAHIGNFRAYMFEDLLRRTLQFCSYRVLQVMNLTDVDDKTIRDSQKASVSLQEYTEKFKKAFFEDLELLNIEPAEQYPAATDHIPEMIDMIKILLEKGYAYCADDGCIYYSIEKFADYGKLSGVDLQEQRSSVRIKNDEYAKDAVADFALWKAWDEDDGDVFWNSPWGKGRPGWHIECSAMSMKYLGKTFDIHTGGVDNIFPHHEDEIAQSEAANGKKFVNYWLHCGYLMAEGQKMSKSLGNFYTLADLQKKGFSGREIRWVLLGSHYRQQLNFTIDGLKTARKTLFRIDGFTAKLKDISENAKVSENTEVSKLTNEMQAEFTASLENDLNMPKALGSLFEFIRKINILMNNKKVSATNAQIILKSLEKLDMVIGCLDIQKEEEIPEEIKQLAKQRSEARKNKDYAEADRLRDEIQSSGYELEDTPSGARIIAK